MKRTKKFMSAICAMALTLSMPMVAFATDNAVVDTDSGTSVVMSEDFDCDGASVRKTGWKNYSTATLTGGGTWYGGVKSDGTLISNACATQYRSRVYVQAGTGATKKWSGWADAGSHSQRTAQAASSGNKCGYDLDN